MFKRNSHEVKSTGSSTLARRTAKATIARVMVVLVVAGGVAVVATGKAGAAVGPYLTKASPNLVQRSGASTSTAAVGSPLPYKTSVMINCQTAGVAYSTGGSPATDTIWDQLSTGTYVADYWVNTSGVGTFSPGIPRCGSLLQNLHSLLCLDSNGSATGPRMHQWSCSGTNSNQEYAMQYTGNGNWYTIKNIAYNECVDVPGGSTQNGVQLQLYPCNNTGAQWFDMASVNQEVGSFELVNWNSGKCVDVYDWSTQNGGIIDQWTCGPTVQANQTWIQAVP
jgi:hypothetical protein